MFHLYETTVWVLPRRRLCDHLSHPHRPQHHNAAMAATPDDSAPKNLKSTTAPPPPRTLNVQKLSSSRAAELECLHSIISARVDNDFRSQSNKRRRTNSYLVKKKRGRPRSKGKVEDCDCGEVSNRVKRRRMELKGNWGLGFGRWGDGTKRLRTHVWHAKRFQMVKWKRIKGSPEVAFIHDPLINWRLAGLDESRGTPTAFTDHSIRTQLGVQPQSHHLTFSSPPISKPTQQRTMPQTLRFTPLLPPTPRLHPRPGPTCRAHPPSCRKKNGDGGGGGGGEKTRKKEGLEWKCVEGCGACCKLYKGPTFATPEEIFQNQDDVELYHSLIGSDGWCKHYDKRTRTCSIYADRPYFCRAEPDIFKTLYGISERKFDKEACRSFGYRESSDQAVASIFTVVSKVSPFQPSFKISQGRNRFRSSFAQSRSYRG
ncbi:Ribonucleases P/MRP protein subunit POP1-like protein [Drosera capensis]